MTLPALFAICSVREPMPGPTSITAVSRLTSALSRTLWMTLASIRKFCPRLFLNVKPYLFNISFVLDAVAISFISFILFQFREDRVDFFFRDPVSVQLIFKLLCIGIADVQPGRQIFTPCF